MRAVPELDVPSALIGVPSNDQKENTVLAADRSIGLREIYWRVCVTSYLLACVAPKTLGAYVWRHIPAVNSLLLMSMSERFFYPPAFADAEGAMQRNAARIAAGGVTDALPSSFAKFVNMVARASQQAVDSTELTESTGYSDSGRCRCVDVYMLTEEASQLCPMARTLEGVYDVDRFILQEEQLLWDRIFKPRPKTNSQGATTSVTSNAKTVIAAQSQSGTAKSVSSGKRSRPDNDDQEASRMGGDAVLEGDREGRGSREEREVKKSRTHSSLATTTEATDIGPGMDLSAAAVNARRSTRQRVTRFDVGAILSSADTDDESSSSSEDEEESRAAKRSRKRRMTKPSFARLQRAAAVQQYLQSVTRWGIPDSADIVFLPLQLLCRVPPADIIKSVRSWNTKFRFGAQLRQSVDPDFIADVTGGRNSSGDQNSRAGTAVSSREDVLQSIGWLVPAIVADINNILNRIPMVACIHILLVTLVNVSQKLGQFGVLGGSTEVVDVLENTPLGEDVRGGEAVRSLQRVKFRDHAHAQMLGDMLVSRTHRQDVILCRGLVSKVRALLAEHRLCSPEDVAAIRQLCFTSEVGKNAALAASKNEFASVMGALVCELCHTTASRREVGKTSLHLLFNSLQKDRSSLPAEVSLEDFDESHFFSLFSGEGESDGLYLVLGDVLTATAALDSTFSFFFNMWTALNPLGGATVSRYCALAESTRANICSQLVVSMSKTHISLQALPGLRQVVGFLLDIIDSGKGFGWVIPTSQFSAPQEEEEKLVLYKATHIRIEVLLLCGLCATLSARQCSTTPAQFASDCVSSQSLQLFATVTAAMPFAKVESVCLKPFLEMGKVESPTMSDVLLRDISLDVLAALVMKYAFPLPFVVRVLDMIERTADNGDLPRLLHDPCDFVRELVSHSIQISRRSKSEVVDIMPGTGWKCFNDWKRLIGVMLTADGADDCTDDEDGSGAKAAGTGTGTDDGAVMFGKGLTFGEFGAQDASSTMPYDSCHLDVFMLNIKRQDIATAAQSMKELMQSIEGELELTDTLTDILRRMCCSCSLAECLVGVDVVLQTLARRLDNPASSGFLARLICHAALHAPLRVRSTTISRSEITLEATQCNLAQVSTRLCLACTELSCGDLLGAWKLLCPDASRLIADDSFSDYTAHIRHTLLSVLHTILNKLWVSLKAYSWKGGDSGVTKGQQQAERGGDYDVSASFIRDVVGMIACMDLYHIRDGNRCGHELEDIVDLVCKIAAAGRNPPCYICTNNCSS
jgi:hypothetical protein